MMMMGTLVLLSIAYALGFLSVIVVEVAAVLFLIRRLNRKVALEKQKVNESSSPELDPSIYNKQVSQDFSPLLTFSFIYMSFFFLFTFGFGDLLFVCLF